MTDFFSSDAGQCASVAKAYLEGARVLDEAQLDSGRILFRPTLALAGHGLELMLKACYFLNGQQPPTSGNKGHKIENLWTADVCEPLRGFVYANARFVAEADRSNPNYLGIPNDDEVLTLIEEYVVNLCRLHGEVGYPLRYPSTLEKVGPRTPFLVKTLWRTADELVRRPNEFKPARFRGEE